MDLPGSSLAIRQKARFSTSSIFDSKLKRILFFPTTNTGSFSGVSVQVGDSLKCRVLDMDLSTTVFDVTLKPSLVQKGDKVWGKLG